MPSATRNFLASLGLLGAIALGAATVAGCDPATGTGPAPAPSPVVQATATTAAAPAPVATATLPAPVTQQTEVPAPAEEQPVTPAPEPAACGTGYYRNVDGHCVPRPVTAAAPPPGATAVCKDGTFSYSQNHSGTCSHHGGVARWL